VGEVDEEGPAADVEAGPEPVSPVAPWSTGATDAVDVSGAVELATGEGITWEPGAAATWTQTMPTSSPAAAAASSTHAAGPGNASRIPAPPTTAGLCPGIATSIVSVVRRGPAGKGLLHPVEQTAGRHDLRPEGLDGRPHH
jgi:hypothetical protein